MNDETKTANIRIAGKEYECEIRDIPLTDLKLDPSNPRLEMIT